MEATSLGRHAGVALPRSRRLLAALDDDRLVAQLRHGNDAAFEVIYDRHHRGVLALCRHMLGSREEAEDALQHAFAAAYSDLLSHDRDVRLKPWLYAIARNRCLSVLRARREQPSELADDAATDGFSDEVAQRDDLRHLLSDLRELPEEQRSALVLAEVGGLGHADVAAVLGCDVSKVKSLVFQARSGLIERRTARESSCEEIREQLATLRGGSLRRGPLRRHVRACPSCAAFRDDVRRQRAMLAVALPVLPSAALKENVLAAAGLGGAAGAGGIAAGTGALATGSAKLGGGGFAGLVAKAGVAKVAVAVVASSAAVGGGAAVVSGAGEEPPPPARSAPSDAAPAATPASGAAETREERRAERAERSPRGGERGRPSGEPGEHGRANARTRGRGRKLGLLGDRGARGRARRPASPPGRARPVPRAQRPVPRAAPPVRPAPRPQQPAPRPAPAQPVTPAPQPPAAPRAEPPARERGTPRGPNGSSTLP
jgi:RNA polymerase sigma factor (sigma-70 family)